LVCSVLPHACLGLVAKGDLALLRFSNVGLLKLTLHALQLLGELVRLVPCRCRALLRFVHLLRRSAECNCGLRLWYQMRTIATDVLGQSWSWEHSVENVFGGRVVVVVGGGDKGQNKQ